MELWNCRPHKFITLIGRRTHVTNISVVCSSIQPDIFYSFGVAPNGASPQASLIQVPFGSFYGTTYSGGFGRSGSVFKIHP